MTASLENMKSKEKQEVKAPSKDSTIRSGKSLFGKSKIVIDTSPTLHSHGHNKAVTDKRVATMKNEDLNKFKNRLDYLGEATRQEIRRRAGQINEQSYKRHYEEPVQENVVVTKKRRVPKQIMEKIVSPIAETQHAMLVRMINEKKK